jgi:hypothetical protein
MAVATRDLSRPEFSPSEEKRSGEKFLLALELLESPDKFNFSSKDKNKSSDNEDVEKLIGTRKRSDLAA